MNALSEFAGAWWDWAFAASWQIALLVCVVAALTYLLRDASPRLRHGLWLLVLIKALLPPTLSTFWGVGTWGVAPVAELNWPVVAAEVDAGIATAALPPSGDGDVVAPSGDATAILSAKTWLFGVWAAGCSLLWLTIAWRYWRVTQRTLAMRRVDEGPARVELERLADRFSVRRGTCSVRD